ncbi:MAG: hypothetical protein LBF43_04040 [Puniceicoccales bacterium]|jgi:type III secretion system needle length determinant|nr:hypothetical protein [Puniceicoccales bacterium]
MPQVNTPQTITPDPSYQETTQDAAGPTLSADPSSVKAFNELLKKSAVNAQDQLPISPQWTPFTAQTFKDDITTGVPSIESKNTAEDTASILPALPNVNKMFTQTTTQNADTYSPSHLFNQQTVKEGTASSMQATEGNEATPMLPHKNFDQTPTHNTSAESSPHGARTYSPFTDKFVGATPDKIPVVNRPTASQVDETTYTTQNNPLPVGLPSSTSNGDTILNNLQSFSQTSATTALDHSHRLQQIKTELVDQILISSNALENKQVVKVALNPQLLAGTEVNLQKQGNNLQVTFVTTNTQSETFLINTQPNLQTHLVERLHHFQDISVSVNGTRGNAASAQGQPQDGRSRNRYEYQTPEDSE